MALSRESLLEALKDQLGIDITSIQDDSPLFSSGLVDSFSLVELIVFIETAAQIKVQPLDVNLENLDSVERILNFANRSS